MAHLNQNGNCPLCLLVGTGLDTENKWLTHRISELGLDDKVRLLGRRNDIPAVMNALDIHVMSSAFGEAFPNVLSEAMACETPCVSTDVGDARQIVGDTGLIVPAGDPNQLAAAIAELLKERTMPAWHLRKQAARGRVTTLFSIERMVENSREVWFDGIDSPSLPKSRPGS
jgi:glycosyltransferase involved in cell wall biosynthesis